MAISRSISSKDVYFEAQEQALCGLHALNGLLQFDLGDHFTKAELDQYADALAESDPEERGCFGALLSYICCCCVCSNFRNSMGDYDVTVLCMALADRGLDLQWWDRRKRASAIDFDQEGLIGMLVNGESHSMFASLASGRHWFAIRRIGDSFWNLDSTNDKPKHFFDVGELKTALQTVQDEEGQIILVRVKKPSEDERDEGQAKGGADSEAGGSTQAGSSNGGLTEQDALRESAHARNGSNGNQSYGTAAHPGGLDRDSAAGGRSSDLGETGSTGAGSTGSGESGAAVQRGISAHSSHLTGRSMSMRGDGGSQSAAGSGAGTSSGAGMGGTSSSSQNDGAGTASGVSGGAADRSSGRARAWGQNRSTAASGAAASYAGMESQDNPVAMASMRSGGGGSASVRSVRSEESGANALAGEHGASARDGASARARAGAAGSPPPPPPPVVPLVSAQGSRARSASSFPSTKAAAGASTASGAGDGTAALVVAANPAAAGQVAVRQGRSVSNAVVSRR